METGRAGTETELWEDLGENRGVPLNGAAAFRISPEEKMTAVPRSSCAANTQLIFSLQPVLFLLI